LKRSTTKRCAWRERGARRRTASAAVKSDDFNVSNSKSYELNGQPKETLKRASQER